MSCVSSGSMMSMGPGAQRAGTYWSCSAGGLIGPTLQAALSPCLIATATQQRKAESHGGMGHLSQTPRRSTGTIAPHKKGGTCMMANWALPEIDLSRCDRCGRCVEHCPAAAVEMLPSGPAIVRPDDCTFCTDCEAVCPQDAIRCGYEIVWSTAARTRTDQK